MTCCPTHHAARYEVTLDFAPKLAEIPGSVLPLLLLSRLGYVPNIDKQNDEVLWVIRLSFSVGTRGCAVPRSRPLSLTCDCTVACTCQLIPAFFTAIGMAVLWWYPGAAVCVWPAAGSGVLMPL